MIKQIGKLLVAFGLIAGQPPVPAQAAKLFPELHIQNITLADALADARAKAYRLERKDDNSLDIPESEQCYGHSLPLDDWRLLATDVAADRSLFNERLGRHLGLNTPFDPLNEYHDRLMVSHVDLFALHDAFLDEPQVFEAIGTWMFGQMKERFAKEKAFWPPELDADLVAIQVGRNGFLKKYLSDLLIPRAQMELEMLKSLVNVCADNADHKGNAARFEKYFSNRPL